MIDDSSRLRHPREGGATESGICCITNKARFPITLVPRFSE